MLHIILLILKIIGFVVLGLLALILLLVLILLLAPMTCTVNGRIDNSLESLEGRVRFHWLFRLVSGEAVWRDGKLSWRIRAAWKRFGDAGADPKEESVSENRRQPEISEETGGPEKTASPVKTEAPAKTETPAKAEAPEKTDAAIKTEVPAKSQTAEKQEVFSVVQLLYKRIKSFLQRIKYTFRQFCDKIKALSDKKERITSFLTDEIHRAAFSRAICEIKRLLTHFRPDRAEIRVTFGFDDPSHTGYALAGISLIYPVIGSYTSLTPDFEHKVLRGSVFLKEKFRLLYVVIFAWNMVFDRNVRTTYRHIREFKW